MRCAEFLKIECAFTRATAPTSPRARMISNCGTLVEHPELVAQRIARFADVVGRERVLASNDCGFATAGAGDEVHPDVAWAKLGAMVEGARLASERLWR